MLTSLFQWLPSAAPRNRAGRSGRQHPRRPRAVRRWSYVPRLTLLEDRTLPSTFTVMNLADSGAGSLRQAILDAQADGSPAQISFNAGMQGMIVLTSGPLSITGDLTISGPGADQIAISGNRASRVFSISGATTEVAMNGLTITNGLATGVTLTDAASGNTLTTGVASSMTEPI